MKITITHTPEGHLQAFLCLGDGTRYPFSQKYPKEFCQSLLRHIYLACTQWGFPCPPPPQPSSIPIEYCGLRVDTQNVERVLSLVEACRGYRYYDQGLALSISEEGHLCVKVGQCLVHLVPGDPGTNAESVMLALLKGLGALATGYKKF